MKKNLRTILILMLILNLGTKLSAQEHHEEHSNAHESSSHIHKHHIGVFNGATTNTSHNITSYTIGGDYEFRFNKKIGLTALGEYVGGDANEIVLGIGAMYHLPVGIKFTLAPMVIVTKEDHSEVHQTLASESEDRERTFAIRIGVAYDFYLGDFTVGPVFNADLGDASAFNYGIAIGYGF